MRSHLATALVIAALAGCSGGGGGATPAPAPPPPPPPGPVVATTSLSVVAGDPAQSGFVDGPAASARFALIRGVTLDGQGNIYVAAAGPPASLRRISADGTVSTIAGGGNAPKFTDGQGQAAGFADMGPLAMDRSGNVLLVDNFAFVGLHGLAFVSTALRQIAPAGAVTTLYPSNEAMAGAVRGIVVDATGAVYWSGGGCFLLPPPNVTTCSGAFARVVPQAANIALLVSTPATQHASPNLIPSGLARDEAGNFFMADITLSMIYKIAPDFTTSAVAGIGSAGGTDGIGLAAAFARPEDVVVDSSGNLYVADAGNGRVRKISATGVVTTIADTAGASSLKLPGAPHHLALRGSDLYITLDSAVVVIRNKP